MRRTSPPLVLPLALPLIVALSISSVSAQAPADPGRELLGRARYMIAGGEPEKALELLLAREKQAPDDRSTVLLIGEAYYALEKFEQAIEYFERGLAGDAAQRQRAFNLGRSYELLGRFDEAESVFLPMMQAESTTLSSKGHFGMGLVFEAKGEAKDALALFEKAIELDPDNHRAMYKIAQHLLKSGRPAEAVPRFLRILELRPLHHGAAYNLSLAYRRLGDAEQAAEAHRRWRKIKTGKERLSNLAGQLRKSPGNTKVMEAMADIHFELRQWRDAFQWYQRCLRAKPGDTRLVMKTADTLRGAGEHQMAAGIYRELVDRRPPVEAAVAPLIEMLEKLGQSAEVKELRKRFPRGKSSPDSRPSTSR